MRNGDSANSAGQWWLVALYYEHVYATAARWGDCHGAGIRGDLFDHLGAADGEPELVGTRLGDLHAEVEELVNLVVDRWGGDGDTG